ncbi:hypothetical protein EKL32_28245 [Flavobacterium sp. GSN2]|nr:hypothetical protein EKL32_28245 [Flavobacterium sp. GSN2]
MKKQICYLFLLSLISISCNFNSHYTNREIDREEAERVTTKFYYLLRDKNHKNTFELFSQKFLEITDTTQLNEIYITSDEKLGNITDQTLLSWETNIIEGSNPVSEYLLVYNVKRNKFDSKEIIRLEKENGVIKILAYNVSSDGFFDSESKIKTTR